MNQLDSLLINSQETFKDLFDNAHDLIHLLHPSGEIIYINRSWEKLLGFMQNEVEGKSIYSFIIDEDIERFKQYREFVIQGAYSGDEEIIISFKIKSNKIVDVEGFVSV